MTCGREIECAWCYHIPLKKDPRWNKKFGGEDVIGCLNWWQGVEVTA